MDWMGDVRLCEANKRIPKETSNSTDALKWDVYLAINTRTDNGTA